MKDIKEEYIRIKKKHEEKLNPEDTINRAIGMITENLEELNKEERNIRVRAWSKGRICRMP